MLLFGIFAVFYVLFEAFLISIFVLEFGFVTYLIFSLITAGIGYYFVNKYGFSNFMNRVKVVKPEELFKVFPATIGGVLLMIPGILSKFLGCVFIASSYFIAKKVHDSFNDMSGMESDIIDVEIIDDKK
jgi:UPF0716 family protein affecting phage T7 exclusion